MDPVSALITAALGGLFGMGQTSAESSRAAADRKLSKEQFDAELALQQQAMEEAKKATEEENRRRQIEASFRAGKLEDVANMFQALRGSAGMTGMMDIGRELMGTDSSADLRKASMREMEKGSNQLAALMAQSGVRGSGFAAGQQRNLMGDVMMGLSRDIASNRLANLQAAGGMFGQATQLDMGALQNIANLFSDEAFGANAPLAAGYGMFGANAGLPLTNKDLIKRNNPLVNSMAGTAGRMLPQSRII